MISGEWRVITPLAACHARGYWAHFPVGLITSDLGPKCFCSAVL